MLAKMHLNMLKMHQKAFGGRAPTSNFTGDCDCGWLRCTVVERLSPACEVSVVYARLAEDA